jgi:hypothetical protein
MAFPIRTSPVIEIGLQDLRHTTLPHGTIGVTSKTIVKSREKADSESEEYMFT